MTEEFLQEFTHAATKYIDENTAKLEVCLNELE
jgi:hypothetical protein